MKEEDTNTHSFGAVKDDTVSLAWLLLLVVMDHGGLKMERSIFILSEKKGIRERT